MCACVCVCSVVRECIKSNHTCICSTLLTCECMQVLLCSVDCRGMFVPQCKCVCNNLCFIHALCIHTLWLGASFKECKILPVRERARICCRNSALKHCIAKLQQLQNNKYNHTLTYTTLSHIQSTYVHTYCTHYSETSSNYHFATKIIAHKVILRGHKIQTGTC